MRWKLLADTMSMRTGAPVRTRLAHLGGAPAGLPVDSCKFSCRADAPPGPPLADRCRWGAGERPSPGPHRRAAPVDPCKFARGASVPDLAAPRRAAAAAPVDSCKFQRSASGRAASAQAPSLLNVADP